MPTFGGMPPRIALRLRPQIRACQSTQTPPLQIPQILRLSLWPKATLQHRQIGSPPGPVPLAVGPKWPGQRGAAVGVPNAGNGEWHGMVQWRNWLLPGVDDSNPIFKKKYWNLIGGHFIHINLKNLFILFFDLNLLLKRFSQSVTIKFHF
jgi:hypothetical protein